VQVQESKPWCVSGRRKCQERTYWGAASWGLGPRGSGLGEDGGEDSIHRAKRENGTYVNLDDKRFRGEETLKRHSVRGLYTYSLKAGGTVAKKERCRTDKGELCSNEHVKKKKKISSAGKPRGKEGKGFEGEEGEKANYARNMSSYPPYPQGNTP